MIDLTDDQKSALVRAYERGMRVAIEGDEKDIGPTLKSQRLVYMDGSISPAGELLAQSLIRERELRAAAMIKPHAP